MTRPPRPGRPSPQPAAGSGAAAARQLPAAPRATRLGRPSWLDLRLVAGVALVLVAVLGGARLVSGAGGTTQVWSLARDLPAGAQVTSTDLVPTAVHFAGGAEADRYLAATAPLAADSRLGRSVSAGELLPRAALVSGGRATVQLPLDVSSTGLPPGLRTGTVVDVWAVPSSGAAGLAAGSTAGSGGAAGGAVEVLTGVAVTSVSGGGSFAGSGAVVVTVSVPRDPAVVASVLERLSGRSAVLLPVSGAVDAEPSGATGSSPEQTAAPTRAAGPAPSPAVSSGTR